jgi:hypothetical protein
MGDLVSSVSQKIEISRGDVNDILIFNDAISKIGLLELPLKGRKYTWSNIQIDPFLERLDWFFTYNSWTKVYPSFFVYSLPRPISDHVPYIVVIGTNIPKAKVFRFENCWMQHSSFQDTVQNAWNILVRFTNSAKRINAKFKNMRRTLKLWANSCMKLLISKSSPTMTTHMCVPARPGPADRAHPHLSFLSLFFLYLTGGAHGRLQHLSRKPARIRDLTDSFLLRSLCDFD